MREKKINLRFFIFNKKFKKENQIIKNNLIKLLKRDKSQMSKENYEYKIYKLPLKENARKMFLSLYFSFVTFHLTQKNYFFLRTKIPNVKH